MVPCGECSFYPSFFLFLVLLATIVGLPISIPANILFLVQEFHCKSCLKIPYLKVTKQRMFLLWCGFGMLDIFYWIIFWSLSPFTWPTVTFSLCLPTSSLNNDFAILLHSSKDKAKILGYLENLLSFHCVVTFAVFLYLDIAKFFWCWLANLSSFCLLELWVWNIKVVCKQEKRPTSEDLQTFWCLLFSWWSYFIKCLSFTHFSDSLVLNKLKKNKIKPPSSFWENHSFFHASINVLKDICWPR